MRYIKKNLIPGEIIVYRTKQHWVIFIDSIILMCFSTIFFSFNLANELPFGLLGFVISIIRFLYVLITYIASNFVITNKRIIIKEGFFNIYSEEARLEKVEGIHINQNFIQRILNFGNIVIETAGMHGKTYKNIAKPMEFRKMAQWRITKP